MEPLPHPGRGGARHHLDSGRPRGDLGGLGRGRIEGKPGAAVQQRRRRPRRQRLSRRRGAGRAVLRLADRPARPQEALLHHACGLSRRHGGDRAVLEFLELRAVSLSDRGGDRRRICRDQLDHPGAYPRARARLERSRRQRQLLDRRGARRGRRHRAARSRCHQSGIWLAAVLRHRRGAGAGDLLHAPLAAGKPALADDPWPRRRGRAGGGRHRAARASAACRPHGRIADGAAARARAHAAAGGGAHPAAPVSPAHAGRPRADGRAGVFLQRHLLHLRAGADRFLRHPGKQCRLVHPAVRGGKFPGAAAARAAVRRDRTAADDRLHLHHVGRAAGDQRISVRAGNAQRHAADLGLDRDLLLRLGRGKLGLSHRQRDLPAGNPRARHRVLLCGRHRHRRHGRAVAVRRADRHRLAHEPVRRLSARRFPDDRRGTDRGVLRGAGGAKAARSRWRGRWPSSTR